jgi:hypothetical protein
METICRCCQWINRETGSKGRNGHFNRLESDDPGF